MAIEHSFVSQKADSADTTLVNPSNWNDSHVFTSQVFTATDGQTVFVTTFSRISFVFRGGLKQIVGDTYDYTSSAGTVTFNYPITTGDVIEIG